MITDAIDSYLNLIKDIPFADGDDELGGGVEDGCIVTDREKLIAYATKHQTPLGLISENERYYQLTDLIHIKDNTYKTHNRLLYKNMKTIFVVYDRKTQSLFVPKNFNMNLRLKAYELLKVVGDYEPDDILHKFGLGECQASFFHFGQSGFFMADISESLLPYNMTIITIDDRESALNPKPNFNYDLISEEDVMGLIMGGLIVDAVSITAITKATFFLDNIDSIIENGPKNGFDINDVFTTGRA